MKSFITTSLLLGLLAGPLLSGCKKDDTTTPATPTTGGLSGTVSPVGSITQVTAKNSGGLTFVASPNASTGAFSLADLAPGQYTLSFKAATGYKPVADRTITVVVGQTAAAGTVQATSDGTVKSGTISWTVNGQTYTTTTVSGLLDPLNGGQFYLVGRAATGSQVDEVTLGVNYAFSGVGSHSFGSTFNSAAYQRLTGSVTNFTYVCSSNTSSNPNGTLNVTQYDATAGTAAGTFGFVGVGFGGTTGTATITNGTFSVKF